MYDFARPFRCDTTERRYIHIENAELDSTLPLIPLHLPCAIATKLHRISSPAQSRTGISYLCRQSRYFICSTGVLIHYTTEPSFDLTRGSTVLATIWHERKLRHARPHAWRWATTKDNASQQRRTRHNKGGKTHKLEARPPHQRTCKSSRNVAEAPESDCDFPFSRHDSLTTR